MQNIPECCQDCAKWDKFGKQCWVYWDSKKECTHHSDSLENWSLK